eukprot:2597907-Amphidinium_carterae.1
MATWPTPKKESLGTFVQELEEEQPDSPFARVLRAKGFCWLDQFPAQKLILSHAGKQISLDLHGLWWAAFDERQQANMTGREVAELQQAKASSWSEDH